MRQSLVQIAFVVILGCGWPSAQAPVGDVETVDPAFDAIVSPNARLEVVKDDYFGLLGKPVWVPDAQGGHLLLADPAANAIYKWAPSGGLSVFLEPVGLAAKDNPDAGPTSITVG